MTFLWPEMLWLLLAVPALAAAYLLGLRRKKRLAVRYATLSMVREAMGPGHGLRRHLPPLLLLVAFTVMIGAVARPAAIITLPAQYETVILAMDVSGSMRAGDVKPSRLAAAQAAARAFVAEQPGSTRIGIVAFAAAASVVQAPTRNREDLLAAIDRFQLQRGTAIGSAILVALKTIFPEASFDLQAVNPRRDRARGAPGQAREPDKPAAKPVPPGSYASAAIILLTDGEATTGPDPIEAARVAAERGVRVYTVGVGTPNGEVLSFEGQSFRVRLDEETLKTIATLTRGEYFRGDSAADLKKIYDTLNARLVFEKKESEITAVFSAAAAAAALLSAFLSLLWFNRIL
jgi:Ca-activated chloride channel family protein